MVEVEILENIFQLFEIVVMIPLSRHHWWISSQHPQASQALLFIAFHGTSYLPTALCLPLQQWLKRELVNEKSCEETGQHATSNGKGFQVTSCSPLQKNTWVQTWDLRISRGLSKFVSNKTSTNLQQKPTPSINGDAVSIPCHVYSWS